MTRLQEQAITQWYRWHQEKDRKAWETFSVALRGMRFRAFRVMEGDGVTPLAEVLKMDPPMIRLTLPNQLTWGRHRVLALTLKKLGATVLPIPGNVLRASDLQFNTIEVVDAVWPKEPFRAQEVLIRGIVKVDLGWVWDSFRVRNVHKVEERETYFLSGFDRNERRLSYFFCELPPGAEPKTVAEAYEALKPQSVLIAERKRLKVQRQGDMFFIPVKRRPSGVIDAGYVHETNHWADNRIIVDGLTYVSGDMKHRPLGRRPDHKPLHLGRRWYLCVKNTVPITR